MARLTRHQLKTDELSTRLAVFQEFFLQNQKKIITGTAVVAVALGVVLGGFFFVSSRQTRASYAFARALATFHATVGPPPPPNSGPSAPRFPTAAEKYQQAYKQFTEVAGRYSWFSQGDFARYYAALCERELGKSPEAEKDLSAIAGGRGRELAALAQMALAGLYEQTGRNEQAEKLYRELVNHPTDIVPKATVQLALAELLQKTKPAEAAELYKKIQTEYPGLAAGSEAFKMLQTGSQ